MRIAQLTLGLLASSVLATRISVRSSNDVCTDNYNRCKSPKDPKEAQDATGKKYTAAQLDHKCGCAQTACLGEDSARIRDYCDKLKKQNWVDIDAGEKPPPQKRDQCQDKYNQCKASKDPKEAKDAKGKKYNEKQLEHKCGCAQTSCLGEDSARIRDYCDKLKKQNWVDVDAGEKPPAEGGDKCQDQYNQCKSPKDPKEAMDAKGKKYNDKQLNHKCGCAQTSCLGEDSARNRDYCDKLKKNNWVDVDAGEKPPPMS